MGIDHPYTTADVVYPDGRHVELDARVADSVLDERIADDTFMLTVFENLGQDAAFTLSELSALDTADPNQILTGRLDLERVGIFGASLGGIATAEACRLDHRFRACLMVDVAMPPGIVESGLEQPAMWIGADNESKHVEGWTTSAINEQDTTVRRVFSNGPGDGYLVLIGGMFHGDISDLPFIFGAPVGQWLGVAGPTDWRKTHGIINAYSLAFFDKYLKDQAEPLLNGSAQFPEATLKVRTSTPVDRRRAQ